MQTLVLIIGVVIIIVVNDLIRRSSGSIACVIIERWAPQGSAFLRVWVGVALGLGSFLASTLSDTVLRHNTLEIGAGTLDR